jgi:TnpA family transposase/ribulose bisphosphate carboxylase small subunit
MTKLEILPPAEQLVFNTPPHLSNQEQIKYFELPRELTNWLDSINNTTHQVGFTLLWAYCQKSMRFYQPRQFREEDMRAVCLRHNLDANSVKLANYNQRTFNYHKQIIRQHINLKPFDQEAKAFFLACIKERVKRHYSPKQILEDVLKVLEAKKIEVPGYNRFALTITKAISDYDKGLIQIIEINLSNDQKTSLDELLQVDQAGFSKIASLKNISHSKKPKKIKESMLDFQLIGEIYRSITSLLGALNMHSDTIKHYATWVRKASLFQITQLQASKRYLYLICFIIHQYQLRQDILADILLSSVQSTQNSITKSQKEQAFSQREQQIETLQLLSASRISQKVLVKTIDQITNLPDLSDTQKVNQIKQLLEEYYHQAATHSPEPQLDVLAQQALEEMDTHNYYRTVEDFSLKLQNRAADILRKLEFDETDHENPPEILLAIQHYQDKVGNVGKESPINFLTSQEQDELYTPASKFRVSLYKALLYFHTADAIKAGVISLKPSYRYLSLENYLHPKAHWLDNKYYLLEEAGLLAFADIDQLLKLLRSQLHTGYHTTNRHIRSGKNLYIKFDTKDKMVLATPKVEKLNTQPVSALFADQKYTSILKILSDTQRLTNYLDCFRHHHVKDKRVLPQTSIFYAAILGLGCNIGVNKMANVSKGITEDNLANFVNWHMSIDNINEANGRILHLLGQLDLAKIYQKNPQELHTSSDGRKVHVGVESLNANQSFKYFGNRAGSSLYSFIDELNRVFYATFISSSEREAAYVADGLLHNLSIKSSIHSTDTHGYSEAVFAVLHLLGIYFAPRIKNLQKATLYSFESRRLYEAKGYKILPDRYINADLIKKYWDDILRLMITIQLKATTTSQIFKRLSSYSKQHPLYCAIKEFGRIIKSLFILRYIDRVDLRQAVEKQLNRIELSNKFSKAILFGNNQEIQYAGKEEQEIVVACQRLIQNTIVLWNALFLSQKLATIQDEEKRKALLTIIRNGSTLVWDYVNLHGEYDFTQDIDQLEMLFDMHKILALKVA